LGLEADEGLDLSPLRSLRLLGELSISDCDDLSPLEGLTSLKKLSVCAGRVQPNLEPLRGLVGLRHLSLHGMKIDPSGVASSLGSLVSLTVSSCEAPVDTRALARLRELEVLDLGLSPVTDVRALASLQKLRVLDLCGTGIRTLPPLRDLPRLEELNVALNYLPGLEGVEHALVLRKLNAGPSDLRAFSDLTPLASLSRLEELHLDQLRHLVDLSPLRGLTRLRVLHVADSAVGDLRPLAGMTALENVTLSGTFVESVEPLVGLPRLRFVGLSQCSRLRTIRPLAACAALESVDCDDCEALQGPTSLEELRAPRVDPQLAKRFPSAGLPTNRAGTVATFDARAHLPKRPPEGWSLPERGPDEDDVFWLDAEERVCIGMTLLSRDDAHLVVVHMFRHDRGPLTDKEAGRILRRFRASGAFVETDESPAGEVPGVRCFIARAHAASPDTWGAWRARGAFLRIEEGADDGAARGRDVPVPDVRQHLPSPLPPRWSVHATTKQAEDVACYVSAPDGEMTVFLHADPASDLLQLVVSIAPPRGGSVKVVADELARTMLTGFRGRGAFEESSFGPFARLPGARMFVAPIK
jgi:hypothetical protein